MKRAQHRAGEPSIPGRRDRLHQGASLDPEVHRVLIDKVFPHQAGILKTDDLEALTGVSPALTD